MRSPYLPLFSAAAYRPASPAAHSTYQAWRLAHEINANRGRVHAVVMLRVPGGMQP